MTKKPELTIVHSHAATTLTDNIAVVSCGAWIAASHGNDKVARDPTKDRPVQPADSLTDRAMRARRREMLNGF